MPLLLSRDELKPLLDLDKAIELIEEAHRQQAQRANRAACAVSYSSRRP